MRKYHFREFPLQIWQKLIVNKIWIDREKARRNKKGMKRKGFFLSTIRISLSNGTIMYLLQPIRSAYKNTEIVRGAKTKGWERWRRSFLPSLTLTILISNHNYDITVTLIFNQWAFLRLQCESRDRNTENHTLNSKVENSPSLAKKKNKKMQFSKHSTML